jgi:serine/threonine protein kinase
MINSNGEIMLVDFGIAKAFQTGIKGTMIGTEGYSPPEQYRGEATQAADIYSMGATIHHALTRRDPRLEPPFSFAERPIRRINPAVSADLDVIVNRALEYDPASRFKSAAEMKDALVSVARKTGMLVRMGSQTGPMKTDGIKPLWKFKCEDEVRGTPTISQSTLYIVSYDNNLYALDAADGKFQWKYPTDGVLFPARWSWMETFIQDPKIGAFMWSLPVRESGDVLYGWSVRSSPSIAEGHVFLGSDDNFLHSQH